MSLFSSIIPGLWSWTNRANGGMLPGFLGTFPAAGILLAAVGKLQRLFRTLQGLILVDFATFHT